MTRSYEQITRRDLRRLADLAREDRNDLFTRKPDTGRLYRNRLFAVALCQGGALHYLDGKNGIKDLDVWSFFEESLVRPYPYRRRAARDFGDPKFGRTEGFEHFEGRCVDLIGRSIKLVDRAYPVATLQRYLAEGRTTSSRWLSKKAMILLEPAGLLGTVVWRPSSK